MPNEFPQATFSLAWSPDQEYLAVGGESSIWILDSATWLAVGYLNPGEGNVYSLAWSPDSKYLLSGSDAARVWDPFTGKVIFKDKFSTLGTVSWSSDGNQFSSANRIFGLSSVLPTASVVDQSVAIRTMAVSPDDGTVAVGHDDGAIEVWDVVSGDKIADLRGHSGHILGLAWSPDDKLLASGGHDNTVRIWDLDTGEPVQIFQVEDTANSLRWSRDGAYLLGVVGNQLLIWDVENDYSEKPIVGKSVSDIYDIEFTPDGSKFAVSREHGQIEIWVFNPHRLQEVIEGHTNFVYQVDWSPDGKDIASAGFDGSFRVWRVKDTLQAEPLTFCENILDTLYDIAWSPNGKYLAAANRDGLIDLWHSDSCERVGSLVGHMDAASGVAWSSDGTMIFSSSWDGTLRVWQIPSE